MIKILDKFYFNRTVGWLFDINNLSNIINNQKLFFDFFIAIVFYNCDNKFF